MQRNRFNLVVLRILEFMLIYGVALSVLKVSIHLHVSVSVFFVSFDFVFCWFCDCFVMQIVNYFDAGLFSLFLHFHENVENFIMIERWNSSEESFVCFHRFMDNGPIYMKTFSKNICSVTSIREMTQFCEETRTRIFFVILRIFATGTNSQHHWIELKSISHDYALLLGASQNWTNLKYWRKSWNRMQQQNLSWPHVS